MRAATFIASVALSLGPAVPAHCAMPDGAIQYLPAIAGDYFAIDSRAADHRYHVFIS